MTDIAELGVRIDTRQVQTATQHLARIADVGADAEVAARRVAKATEEMSRAQGSAARSSARQAAEVQNWIRRLDGLEGASREAARAQLTLESTVDAFTRGAKRQGVEVQAMIDRLRGVDRATEEASQSTLDYVNRLNQQAQAFDRLRGSIDPVFAASKSYEAAVEQVNAAVRAGIVSQEEAARVIDMAAKRYLVAGDAMEQFGLKQTRVSGGLKGLAPQITQAGFQFQDLAVQIGAGVAVSTAMAQQLPQLFSVFGMVGNIALVGSLLGVVAAVGIPVVSSLMRSRDAAAMADTAFEGMRESLDAYRGSSNLAQQSLTELTAKYGENAQAVRDNISVLNELAQIEAIEATKAAIRTIGTEITDVIADLDAMRAKAAENPNPINLGELSRARSEVEKLAESLDLTTDEAMGLSSALDNVQGNGNLQEAAGSAQDLADFLLDAYGEAARMPPQVREIYRNASEAAQSGYEISASMNESANNASRATGASNGLSGAIARAANMAAVLVRNLGMVPTALANMAGEVEGVLSSLERQNATLNYQIERGLSSQAASIKAMRDEALNAMEIEGASYEDILKAGEAFDDQAAKAETLATSIAGSTEQLNLMAEAAAGGSGGRTGGGSGGSGGGAAGAATKAAKATEDLRKEIEQLEFDADPVKKYRSEMEKLDKLRDGGLSDGAYAKAVQDLNDELADSVPMVNEVSNAFGDFVSRGLTDFKGFVSDIIGSFQKMLSQMIALAARNRILIGLGLGGGAAGATAAGAVAGGLPGGGLLGGAGGLVGGGGGLLGGLLGSFGSEGSILGLGGLGGGSGLLGGLGNAISGGLGNIFSIGGNAAAAGGGLLASVGAALPVIGIAAAAFGLFRTKTKELDRGIRVTVNNLDTLVESFRKVQKSRFLGLSKSKKTTYDVADAALADPITSAVASIQQDVLAAASALGVAESAFEGFYSQIQISTDGMSESEAQKAVEEALRGLADEFAALALQGEAVIQDGEGAAAALERLATSLTAVNRANDLLGLSLMDVSIAGGAAASQIVELLGGVDSFTSAVQNYYGAFYSEQERFDRQMAELTERFNALGYAVPRTRDGFRSLVEGLDLTTEVGRETYAEFLGLASALNQVLPAVQSLSVGLLDVIARANTALDAAITGSTAEARFQEQEASRWTRTVDRLTDTLHDLRGAPGALVTSAEALGYNQNRFRTLLEAAQNGDITAADQLSGAATRLIDSGAMVARTRLEQARLESEVRTGLMSAVDVASSVAARHEQISALLTQQVGVLEEIRDYINSGEVIDTEVLDRLSGRLGNLQVAIGDEIAGMPSLVRDAMLGGASAFGDSAESFGENFASRVAQPMGVLTDALDALRAQVVEEERLRSAAEDRQMQVARLQVKLSTALARVSDRSGDASSIISQITALEDRTGVDIRQGKGDAIFGVDPSGRIRYRASHYAYGKGDDVAGFRSAFYGKNGLESQLADQMERQRNNLSRVQSLREQIASLGEIPAFATGGMHAGGARIVGEAGPELEVTGPSRIYNAAQTRSMLGGADMVAEIKLLREEVSRLRSEQLAVGVRVAENTGDSARIAKRQDREQRAAPL